MNDFGKLSHLVKLCTLTPRHARIAIHGGGGSGKTYSALQLARGLLGPGGRIVLVSLGENRAEELYAGVCEFWHVDASHPDVLKAAQAAYPTQRGGLPWEGEGADPRAVLYVLRQVAEGAGLGGVIILDSISEVWDGIKGRVDTFTGGVEAKNRFAWAAVAPVSSALWEAIETAPCHTIITVRAKTTVHMEPRGKGQVPVHVPTDPELRNRDEFRMDVRIFVDSEHRARFAGRLTAINESTVDLLTPDIGARLKVLLGGDPARTLPAPSPRVYHPREQPAITEPVEDAEVDDGQVEDPIKQRLYQLAEAIDPDGSPWSEVAVLWYLASRPQAAASSPTLAACLDKLRVTDAAWVKTAQGMVPALQRRMGIVGGVDGARKWLRALPAGCVAEVKASAASDRHAQASTAGTPGALLGIALAVAEESAAVPESAT